MSTEKAGRSWRTEFSEMGTRPPDTQVNTEFQLRAGPFLRQQIRSLVAQAQMRGAIAEADEQRGRITSLFAIRLEGTAEQLAPVLEQFAELGER